MSHLSQTTKHILDMFLHNKLKQTSAVHVKARLVVASVLLTSILMWTYAIICYFYVSDPYLKYLGIVYAAVHLQALSALRFGGSPLFATNLLLTSGFLFQIHYGFLNGGPESMVLMWVAILPVIAALLGGQTLAHFWLLMVSLVLVGMVAGNVAGYPYAITLAADVRSLVCILTIVGFLVLNFAFALLMLYLEDSRLAIMEKQVTSKSQMLKILSHDINNPLAAMMMAAMVLEKKLPADDSLGKFAVKIINHGRRISDILESAKLLEASETGKLNIPLETYNLKDSILQVKQLLEDKLESKKIRLVGNALTESVQIKIHRSFFENEVLSNIISNSIKFSRESSEIAVTVSQNSRAVEISIKDKGIGMSPEIQKTIFDPFTATSRPGTQGESGTGFGMPITKAIVESMGGRIYVTSKEQSKLSDDSGTEFRLTFPKHTDSDQPDLLEAS